MLSPPPFLSSREGENWKGQRQWGSSYSYPERDCGRVVAAAIMASETGRKGSGKAARISALPVTRLTRALHTRCALKIQQKAGTTSLKVGEMFRPALGETAGFRL